MKKTISCLFVFFVSLASQAQGDNPILFSELYGGFSVGSSTGWIGGYNFNLQLEDHLLTARYTGLAGLKAKSNDYIILPIYETVERINEWALLYGKRNVNGNFSFSYSGGISIVNREEFIGYVNGAARYDNFDSFGFPFELNVKWFNPKKEQIRIYYLIPVGKPTAFGSSIGFKLIGNISKTTFVGVGISYGFGWHKKY